MNILDIIAKKRDRKALSPDEIRYVVQGYTAGDLPDYQIAAWLMAVYLRGMNRKETVALTQAMADSGERLNLSAIVGGFAVDKHSSGGVGDKTSLVVAPLVAACGVPVAKMSGRGLGHTGGTLDKLESIRGYQVELSRAEFERLAKENGLVLAGQSAALAPADKKLYALRDITATVASRPLIASSIMSKKLAAGADGIVLDVKVGRGAFMTDLAEARKLAQTMVDIGADSGKKMIAVLSDMNQPLGATAGLALEVKEAIETLRGAGAADFREHCLVMATHMLRMAGVGIERECRARAELALIEGTAWQKFRQMVMTQGGDVAQVDEPDNLPKATIIETMRAPRAGFIESVDALAVGQAVLDLGGGRLRLQDPIDHAVGVVTRVKVGQQVATEAPLFELHANDTAKLETAKARLAGAVVISATQTPRLPLFYGVLEAGL
jgi:pyrimidine-nucleoside phosphorylase